MLRDDLLKALRLAPVARREPVVVSPWAHLSEAEYEEALAACESDPVDEVALGRLRRRGERRAALGFSERPGPDPRSRWLPDQSRCVGGDPECVCLVDLLDGDLESFSKWDVWRVHVPRHRVVVKV